MAHKDSGWRPDGAMDAFSYYEVWEYNLGPHEINEGEVDGKIDFDEYQDEEGEFATSVDDLDDEHQDEEGEFATSVDDLDDE